LRACHDIAGNSVSRDDVKPGSDAETRQNLILPTLPDVCDYLT
jgi:hypothetical protein